MKREINKLRKEIDEIDSSLINLLDKRAEIAAAIGKIKRKNNLPVINKAREERILSRSRDRKNKIFIEKILRKIIEESRKIQRNDTNQLFFKKLKIGIIGFGNFGAFIAKHLNNKADIAVTDILDRKAEAESMGIKFLSLQDILKRKIIILAVPMESLRKLLNKIKDKLMPETIVLDVCSLKMFSCEEMKNSLGKDIEIIGTHPLFGPQSASNSIQGMKIALCNVSAKKQSLEAIKKFCESLGLQVFITTPKEHDRQMAFSQALTHFIGQVAKRMNIQRIELSTKTFDDLMDVIDIIKNDTKALFENMQAMNPFAKETRQQFIQESIKLDNKLNKLSKQEAKK